ncbi:MAG: dTDP-4-dehydrorhamnose 3,5-epimerase [Lutibacter sp.]|jgi:dTDP-4-dehydrorhamnose 3,5-epimerase|nr:dTDP-4-dehydrorhamnose 3,5-epimerase [Lutibacter sp.]
MNFIPTAIPGLIIIEPQVFGDDRGCFFESFNQESFTENIGQVNFVQDNESVSTRGVLRGLHFQQPPYSQAKLVRCTQGEILDIAVDLRKESPTYQKHLAVRLSAENRQQLFVPRGFAHGFVVLSDSAHVAYKVDNFYAPDYDSGILWNDPALGIDWELPAGDMIISAKDRCLKPLAQTVNPF